MAETAEILRVAAKHLMEYAELEGTGFGEYWNVLCRIASYPYAMTPTFRNAVLTEVRFQLDLAENTLEIVEESEAVIRVNKSLRKR
jgi:hypothetical protein